MKMQHFRFLKYCRGQCKGLSGTKDLHLQNWWDKPRWRLSLPHHLNYVLLTGCILAALSFLFIDRILGITIAAFTVVILFNTRPAVGALITLILFVPDQIITAITGRAAFTPGRLLPVLLLIVCGPLFLTRKILPTETRPFIYILTGLTGWYWVMLVFHPSQESFEYVIQLSLLCVVAFPMVVLLGRSDRVTVVCLGQAIVGICGAIFMLFGPGALRSGSSVRLTYDGLGINSMSNMLGVSFMAALGYIHIGKGRLIKLLLPPGLAVTFLAILRTGTRSVIWGIPLCIILAYALTSGRKFYKYWILGASILLVLGGGLLHARNGGLIGGSLADRVFGFVESTDEVSSNIRYGYWVEAFRWYLSNPIGAGPGTDNELGAVPMGYGNEAHNTFVSTLIQVNVVGLILLLFATVGLGWKAFRIRDPDFRLAAMMMWFYVFLQLNKSSALQTRLFWFPVILCFILVEAAYLHTATGNRILSENQAGKVQENSRSLRP